MSAQHSLLVSAFPLVLIISALLPSFASHYLEKKTLNFNSVVAFVDENFQESDQVLSFKPGFELPRDRAFTLLPFISFEKDSSTDWDKELRPLLETGNRTWIIISSKRRPIARNLENWLLCHSKLVWQKHSVRLDSEFNGYQVYLVSNEILPGSNFPRCS